MNKEEILKMSQLENKGREDERELQALGKASRVGMIVGAILCVIMVVIWRVIDIPELALASLLVYFSMQGSKDILMYYYLKERSKLVFGIIGIICSIVFAVGLVCKIMV